MNDPAAVVAVVASACAAAAYTVRVIANAVLKHKEMENRAGEPAISYSDDRIARIEVAVESIALEVERISEGQRFTAKLLDELSRVSAPRLEKPVKMNTPH